MREGGHAKKYQKYVEAERGYLVARRDAILAEGIDADALVRGVAEAADGTAVLRRFGELLDA